MIYNKTGSKKIELIICVKCGCTLATHSKKLLQRHFAEIQGTLVSEMESRN